MHDLATTLVRDDTAEDIRPRPASALAPKSILDTVGRTPLLRLGRVLGPHQAAVLVKAEHRNPLASVKDRIGLAMIEADDRHLRLQHR